MALLFTGGGSERVNVGSGASIDDVSTGTMAAWIYLTSDTTDGVIYQKAYFGAHGTFHALTVNETTTGQLTLSMQRATGDLAAISAGVLTANNWNFVAARFTTSGANGDQQLFTGSLTRPVSEVGAYSSQLVGSGAHSSDNGQDAFLGNRGNFVVGLPGRIAWFGYWNRRLSLAEIREQQFAPSPSLGCIGFWVLGDKPGIQIDRSNYGNHGTITGAVYAPAIELDPILYPADDWQPWPTAPQGGTNFPISPSLAAMLLTGHGPSLGFTIHMPDQL
jgi:hypothetical protein